MLRIQFYDGDQRIHDLELRPDPGTGPIAIGREASNGVVLPDVSVSRRHAQIEPNGNFFLLRDNGSTNGTFVNEMLARVHVLAHGDTVRIGKYILRVEAGARGTRETTRVRVEDLRLPDRRRLARTDDDSAAAEPHLLLASRERLQRLHEIQRELSYVDDVGALLERTLDIVLAELGADRGSVLLARGKDPTQRVEPEDLESAAARSTTPAPAVFGPDEIVIPKDLLSEAATSPYGARGPGPADPSDSNRLGCMVSPLREHRRLRGVLYLERASGRSGFSVDDLRFLGAISAQLAIGIANAELFREASLEREKVQAILTSLTDGILVTDREYHVMDANSAALVLLRREGEAVVDRDVFELFGAFRTSPETSVLRTVDRVRASVFHLMADEDGDSEVQSVLIAGTIQPYPRFTTEPKGFLFILRDRSDVHRMEDLKKQFIGNVAHKLRTPLTVIQGNLPFLRDGSAAVESRKEILDEMERSSAALCHLVDQFVEHAEMELRALKRLEAPTSLDLRTLLREALEAAKAEVTRKGLLVVDRLGEEPVRTLGRSEYLVKAFRQIIENSVKFASPGGQLVIEAEEGNGYVRLDFTDDGPGIPSEEIESVFYACHQVDREHTGQVPGAGLGLTLARHIVREHGGEIEITSPHRFPDRGTRVSVRLPVASEPKPGDERAVQVESAANESPSVEENVR